MYLYVHPHSELAITFEVSDVSWIQMKESKGFFFPIEYYTYTLKSFQSVKQSIPKDKLYEILWCKDIVVFIHIYIEAMRATV